MSKPFCGFIFSWRDLIGAREAGGHMGYTGQHRHGGAWLLHGHPSPHRGTGSPKSPAELPAPGLSLLGTSLPPRHRPWSPSRGIGTDGGGTQHILFRGPQVAAGPSAPWSEELEYRLGEGGHFASCEVTAASLLLGCHLPVNTWQQIPHHAWLLGSDSSSRRGCGARCRHLPVHHLPGVSPLPQMYFMHIKNPCCCISVSSP